MGKYFGTDGFRGEANIQLTVDHAFKVALCSTFSTHFSQSLKLAEKFENTAEITSDTASY